MPELQSPEIFRAVLDSLQTGVYMVDHNGKILFWNQGAERITGYIQHEVVGRSLQQLILAHCNAQNCPGCGAACPVTRTMHEGKPTVARILLRHKHGHLLPVLMRTVAVRDPQGSIAVLGVSFDVLNEKSRNERNRKNMVPHGCLDDTTGVANYQFTQFNLRENLAAFTEWHVPFGIICVRADQFAHFLAAYGRPAADAILQVIAQTLENGFRPSDFVGRWGEDGFLVILMSCAPLGVERVFARIRTVVASAGIRWWGRQLSVTTSIGYAAAETGDTVDTLLQRARRSLYHAPAGSHIPAGASSHAGPRASGS